MDTCTLRRYTYCHGRTYGNSRVALFLYVINARRPALLDVDSTAVDCARDSPRVERGGRCCVSALTARAAVSCVRTSTVNCVAPLLVGTPLYSGVRPAARTSLNSSHLTLHSDCDTRPASPLLPERHRPLLIPRSYRVLEVRSRTCLCEEHRSLHELSERLPRESSHVHRRQRRVFLFFLFHPATTVTPWARGRVPRRFHIIRWVKGGRRLAFERRQTEPLSREFEAEEGPRRRRERGVVSFRLRLRSLISDKCRPSLLEQLR